MNEVTPQMISAARKTLTEVLDWANPKHAFTDFDYIVGEAIRAALDAPKEDPKERYVAGNVFVIGPDAVPNFAFISHFPFQDDRYAGGLCGYDPTRLSPTVESPPVEPEASPHPPDKLGRTP